MSQTSDAAAAPRTEPNGSVRGAGPAASAASAPAPALSFFSPFRLFSSAASVVGFGGGSVVGPAPVAPPFIPPPSALPPPPGPIGQATGPWVAGVLFSVVPPQALAPVPVPASNKELWYCIIRGRVVGITQSQQMALDAVLGVSHNSMKSHKTVDLAVDAFNIALAAGSVQVRPH
ncbi:hypothetical protein B0H11DRAFT_2231558 [Mycena galericulata]|nr:hypothetical protein B0H11DRAFT_2231558 [Mycena galericulata]